MRGTEILIQKWDYEGFKSSLLTLFDEPETKLMPTFAAMVAVYEGETNSYYPSKADGDLVFIHKNLIFTSKSFLTAVL